MKRYGSVIGLKLEKIAEYKRLHEEVWPGVLQRIETSHMQNYSIFLRQLPDGNYYLFSYFEYSGHDFAEDMKRLAADPVTQGPCASRVRRGYPMRPKENGGQTWRKSSTRTNCSGVFSIRT